MPPKKKGGSQSLSQRLAREAETTVGPSTAADFAGLLIDATDTKVPDKILCGLLEVPPDAIDLLLPRGSEHGIRARVFVRGLMQGDFDWDSAKRGEWVSAVPISDADGLTGVKLTEQLPSVRSDGPTDAYWNRPLEQLEISVLQIELPEGRRVVLATTDAENGLEYTWPDGFEPLPTSVKSTLRVCSCRYEMRWTFPGANNCAGQWSATFAAASAYHQWVRTRPEDGPFNAPDSWHENAKLGLGDFSKVKGSVGRLVPELYALKGYALARLVAGFVAYWRRVDNVALSAEESLLADLAASVYDGEKATLRYDLAAVDSVGVDPQGITCVRPITSASTTYFSQGAFGDHTEVEYSSSQVFSGDVIETFAPLLAALGPSDLEVRGCNYILASTSIGPDGGIDLPTSMYTGVTSKTVAQRRGDDVALQQLLVEAVAARTKALLADTDSTLLRRVESMVSNLLAGGPPPAAAATGAWMSGGGGGSAWQGAAEGGEGSGEGTAGAGVDDDDETGGSDDSEAGESVGGDAGGHSRCSDASALCKLVLVHPRSARSLRVQALVATSALNAAEALAAGRTPLLIVGAWTRDATWNALCDLQWVNPRLRGACQSLLWSEAVLMCVLRHLLRSNARTRPMNHLITCDAIPDGAVTRMGRLRASTVLADSCNLQIQMLMAVVESEWTASELARSLMPLMGKDFYLKGLQNFLYRLLCRVEDALSASPPTVDRLELFGDIWCGEKSYNFALDGAPRLGRLGLPSRCRAAFILYGLSLIDGGAVDETRAAFLAGLRKLSFWPRDTERDHLSDAFLSARAEGRRVN